jgi:RNA polymerase sigma factor (sigma-70 family)
VRSAEQDPSLLPTANPFTIGEQRVLSLIKVLRVHLASALSPSLQKRITVEDVVQETCVRAFSTHDETVFESDMQCLAWLKRIASNFVIDTINRRRPMFIADVGRSSFIAKALIDSGQFTASDLISQEECRQILGLAVEKLETHHKYVIEQKYFHHKTFEQIAEGTGSSPAAVRGLHRTAINRLKDLVGDMTRFLSSQT